MDKEQAIKGLTLTYPDVSHNSTQCISITYVTCVFFESCVLSVTPISPGIDGSLIWWRTSTWATREIPFKSETFTERWWVTCCSTSLPSDWQNTTVVRLSIIHLIILDHCSCVRKRFHYIIFHFKFWLYHVVYSIIILAYMYTVYTLEVKRLD